MLDEFLYGARCLFAGFAWLVKPGIKRYVILPLLINLILFVAAIVLGGHYFGAWLNHWISALPHWLAWLGVLLWVIFGAAAAVVLFYTFALVASMLAAPFDIFLSMKIEAALTGRRPESGHRLAMDIAIGLRSQLQRLLYILWRAILMAIVGVILIFVPVFGVFTLLLWFAFTAWTLAIVYADFPLSNRGVAFPAQRRLFRGRRMQLFGFGVATALCTTVPVVNFVIMPAAVAGATLLWTGNRAQNP